MIAAAEVPVSIALKELLVNAGQSDVWDWYSHQPSENRLRLGANLAEFPWLELQSVFRDWRQNSETAPVDEPLQSAIQPPEQLLSLAGTPDKEWIDAREAGELLLREERVAAVVVAGGLGSRLGFDRPKGMFPFAALSGKTLFQWQCELLQFRRNRYDASIPYIVMTSDATHQATLEFFEKNRYFGLPEDDVWFARQGNLPAVDAMTGEALFADEGSLALTPDGHGGLLRALTMAGLWERLRARGITTLFYHQVDNPAVRMCDPSLLGFHQLHRAEVTTKVARKRSAEERMGLAVRLNGLSQIVEYSDLDPDVARQKDDEGKLRYWAGNTGIHVFDVAFLERVAAQEQLLPLHVAHKVVPYWDRGKLITSATPNAIKFERFIFDVLPLAKAAVFVEADREAEFLPIKNRIGADSPDEARESMCRLHRSWLRKAGVEVGSNIPVEISPLLAADDGDLSGLFDGGVRIEEPMELLPTPAWNAVAAPLRP